MSINGKKPQFSIVLAVHDQAHVISQNLPLLLTQQYEEGYEVIVVDKSSTDETSEVLKQLKADHPRLYTTFLPKYQFQKNRQRLALTIGVKAAKNKWIIFIDIDKKLPSSQWLEELSEHACAPTELVLGYFNQKNSDMRLQLFEDANQARKFVIKHENEKTRGHDGGQWFRYLRHKYDFIMVSYKKVYETLQLFEPKGNLKF